MRCRITGHFEAPDKPEILKKKINLNFSLCTASLNFKLNYFKVERRLAEGELCEQVISALHLPVPTGMGLHFERFTYGFTYLGR